MINVIASIRVKAGRREEFVAIFKSNVANVLQEKGCIEYVPTVDVQTGLSAQDLDANLVTIIEKWESVEDLKAHLSAPHMLAYGAKVKDLVEDRSIRILSQA
jgi:quinol monooxygenase YgiN